MYGSYKYLEFNYGGEHGTCSLLVTVTRPWRMHCRMIGSVKVDQLIKLRVLFKRSVHNNRRKRSISVTSKITWSPFQIRSIWSDSKYDRFQCVATLNYDQINRSFGYVMTCGYSKTSLFQGGRRVMDVKIPVNSTFFDIILLDN